MTGLSGTADTCEQQQQSGGAKAASSDRPRLLRILVLALEFTYSPFSGNGMYGRSVVKSLLDTGGCEVAVVCARPHRHDSVGVGGDGLSSDHHIEGSTEEVGDGTDDGARVVERRRRRLELWPVDPPPGSSWNRLDDASPWEEFAAGAAERYADRAAGWNPDAALVIDWHGAAAWRSLAESWPVAAAVSDLLDDARGGASRRLPPVLYFNFRVYSSGLCPSKADWYEGKEREALSAASGVFCLCRGDAASLKRLLPSDRENVEVRLLHPALRGDMHDLALTLERPDPEDSGGSDLRRFLHPSAASALGDDDSVGSRKFVACAVRLSEEKKPLLFVKLMEHLREVMSTLGLVPLLCGAASDRAYADECRDRLLESYPNAVIIQDFLGPKELAAIFSRTLVNFHPCHYDAYGMTAVEAAAFGAPSIINGGATVGATELLREDGSLQLDLTRPAHELAQIVGGILADAANLSQVRKVAYNRAMGWSEEASGKIILERLSDLAFNA